MNPRVFIKTLGNAPFIGRSCILVCVPGEVQFILDCGQANFNANSVQLEKEINLEDKKYYPQESDFCVITHGHADHCGAIGKLRRDMPVYCSAITKEVIRSQVVSKDNQMLSGLTFKE